MLETRETALRALILPVLGERGRWLAAQNPAWDWACRRAAPGMGNRHTRPTSGRAENHPRQTTRRSARMGAGRMAAGYPGRPRGLCCDAFAIGPQARTMNPSWKPAWMTGARKCVKQRRCFFSACRNRAWWNGCGRAPVRTYGQTKRWKSPCPQKPIAPQSAMVWMTRRSANGWAPAQTAWPGCWRAFLRVRWSQALRRSPGTLTSLAMEIRIAPNRSWWAGRWPLPHAGCAMGRCRAATGSRQREPPATCWRPKRSNRLPCCSRRNECGQSSKQPSRSACEDDASPLWEILQQYARPWTPALAWRVIQEMQRQAHEPRSRLPHLLPFFARRIPLK